MSKFNVCDKVKYIGPDHAEHSDFYPLYGTIGEIKEAYGDYYWVQWPKGSTSDDDYWSCDEINLEAIKTNKNKMIQNINDMTNEEIWEMLKPKMEQNRLKKKMGGLYIGNNLVNGFWVYEANNVHNAIALAYKVGYLRSQKGRPFRIGEKKKKGGHWEPVDPNNLPKEGTRVKYNRECRDYKNKITLGSTGIVRMEGPKHDWFGIRLDDYEGMYFKWLSFDGVTAKSLDMWVEDDE